MSQYQTIDPALADWAEVNSVRWILEYQDVEVRKLYLRPDSTGRVIVSVDAPKDQHTVVRVGQNRRGLSRLGRRAEFPTSVVALPETLDKALQLANDWLSDEVS